jgi:DNA-directed RNA polymerase subunit RPC12/RpoP
MFDVTPDSLSRSRRGICPTCGAAMPLAESGRLAKCSYCGGESSLEHRLRAVEAHAGTLQSPRIKGATRWLRKHARYETCACPGCGAEFEADTEQSIQACKYCGTHCKLETRLAAITTDDVDPPRRRTRADLENERRDRIDYPWDIATEQLCWRVIHEPDLMRRTRLAQHFENWNFINHTAAHFLPWLLTRARDDHDAVALSVCDVIGKLLCQGDPTLWPGVIQACRGAVFDVHAKRAILSELGLGKAVCVKTLIDAAEFAATRDARDYACHALWAVNTLIGRNFDEHHVIAEIVLYRMFYVTGPVLGWALYTMRNSYLRGRYPWQTLARAVDELGADRPEVVPHLLDCFYVPPAQDAAEYRRRLYVIANAASWAGKAAGCEILGIPPEQSLYADAAAAVDHVLDDPRAGASAEKALYGLIRASDTTPEPLNALVAARGEALSERVKREFIRRNPQTPLLDTSRRYRGQSDPKRELDPEVDKWIGAWNEGIHAAVDAHQSRVKELKEMRAKARELEVELFEDEGPATIPLAHQVVQAEQKQAEEEKRIEQTEQEMERLQADYQQRIEALSQKMMSRMNDAKAMRQLSAEITKLSEELQAKMRKLAGG